ncbi:MAG: 16S rRNA (uracil(1498)-N(3))-methyltransferase [Alphaproteobacteria bacterium]|nr:16S rRNA (uracil(1498)-N(3))-methyltransferase [Alphaproteobacteria bacterium]
MIRLFIQHSLFANASIPLDEKQSHYLKHVMRQKDGDAVLLFNGMDGEWRGVLTLTKKHVLVNLQHQTRMQTHEKLLSLIFAPIKRGHGDMVIEKASELGATALYPIITDHTVVARIPIDRYQTIGMEAAEQCERLSVPTIVEAQKLDLFLKNWDSTKPIILCAEQGDAAPIADVITRSALSEYAVMIGPEGGFTEKEFAMLRSLPFIIPVTLGPRILRADTAAIAAISLIQALRK